MALSTQRATPGRACSRSCPGGRPAGRCGWACRRVGQSKPSVTRAASKPSSCQVAADETREGYSPWARRSLSCSGHWSRCAHRWSARLAQARACSEPL